MVTTAEKNSNNKNRAPSTKIKFFILTFILLNAAAAAYIYYGDEESAEILKDVTLQVIDKILVVKESIFERIRSLGETQVNPSATTPHAEKEKESSVESSPVVEDVLDIPFEKEIKAEESSHPEHTPSPSVGSNDVSEEKQINDDTLTKNEINEDIALSNVEDVEPTHIEAEENNISDIEQDSDYVPEKYADETLTPTEEKVEDNSSIAEGKLEETTEAANQRAGEDNVKDLVSEDVLIADEIKEESLPIEKLVVENIIPVVDKEDEGAPVSAEKRDSSSPGEDGKMDDSISTQEEQSYFDATDSKLRLDDSTASESSPIALEDIHDEVANPPSFAVDDISIVNDGIVIDAPEPDLYHVEDEVDEMESVDPSSDNDNSGSSNEEQKEVNSAETEEIPPLSENVEEIVFEMEDETTGEEGVKDTVPADPTVYTMPDAPQEEMNAALDQHEQPHYESPEEFDQNIPTLED